MLSDAHKTIMKAAEEWKTHHGLTIPYLCAACQGPGLTGDPEITLKQVLELERDGLLYRGNPHTLIGEGEYANRWFPTKTGHDLVTSGILK